MGTLLEGLTVGVIGMGNMATAIVRGLLGAGAITPQSVLASSRERDVLERLRGELGVRITMDNMEVARAADVLLLSVKPQQFGDVLGEISGQVRASVIVSVAVGITTDSIDRALGGGLAVVRAMPNTPALVGAGVTGYAPGAHADERALDVAAALLEATGAVYRVDEEHLDAVAAISGSGPAYFFAFVEALAAAGAEAGLDAALAMELASGTLSGAGRLLAESPDSAATLRRKVTSPGGTTQEALRVFSGELEALVERAVAAAVARGRELGRAAENG